MSHGVEHIHVNGQLRVWVPTVASLLVELGVAPQQSGIAVAVNRMVVPRNRWALHNLAAGDHVEVVAATQGG